MDSRNIEIDDFWLFRDLHDHVNTNGQGLKLHTHPGFIEEMPNNNYMQKKNSSQNKVRAFASGLFVFHYTNSAVQSVLSYIGPFLL